jgi:hypothetical protein
MVVSYTTKQTKDNKVSHSKESVADEFTTLQVHTLQLCATFRWSDLRNEHYNDLYHFNRPSADN